MNKAITDGIVFMPPQFANGLTVWSAGDGTPGSPTYGGSGTGFSCLRMPILVAVWRS